MFPVRLEPESITDLEGVAKGGNMSPNLYATVWLEELSKLKPEFALKALGLIPADWKHRRPGRPTGSRTAHTQDGAVPQQDVA